MDNPLAWDLRISRTKIATNSGTSGTGSVGIAATTGTSIDAAISCPKEGYASDKMLPVAGPPGSGEYSGNPVLADWFDYEPTTHVVTTKGIVYCVRTVDGKFGAIRIKNYTGGKMTIQWRSASGGGTDL